MPPMSPSLMSDLQNGICVSFLPVERLLNRFARGVKSSCDGRFKGAARECCWGDGALDFMGLSVGGSFFEFAAVWWVLGRVCIVMLGCVGMLL